MRFPRNLAGELMTAASVHWNLLAAGGAAALVFGAMLAGGYWLGLP